MILVGIESTFKNKLIRDPARGGGGVPCRLSEFSKISCQCL